MANRKTKTSTKAKTAGARDDAWKREIERSPDPARARAYCAQLKAGPLRERMVGAKSASIRQIVALLAGSIYWADRLVAVPALAGPLFAGQYLDHPRRTEGLRRELDSRLNRQGAGAPTLPAIRRFKEEQSLRIAARDLGAGAPVTEIIAELSGLAEVIISATGAECHRHLVAKNGMPFHRNESGRWQPTPFAVLGLGKLGGEELNYSSDIDLMFVYGAEGGTFRAAPADGTTPRPLLGNHQFFARLIEMLVNELTTLAPEGMLYRVDLRLRPEGDAGPLARSLAGYENFYAQWGQTWERLMLIKARCVAGDFELAGEFQEIIQPFRYPRFLAPEVIEEVAAVKARIETEVVKSGELERNVKLGRGGIREIEFVVQTLQLLNAGRMPFLQTHQTLVGLEKLVQYRILPRAEAQQLNEAYRFLRQIEHRLQMESNRQTHTLPAVPAALRRLARQMEDKSPQQFQAAYDAHRQQVRTVYDRFLRLPASRPRERGLPADFSDAPAWVDILAQHSFRAPDQALRLARELVHGPDYVHVSARTSELGMQLLRLFLAACPRPGASAGHHRDSLGMLSDPDRVLARLDSYVSAYGGRAVLYELWVNKPTLFRLLIFLFDRSEYLSEIVIRSPDLIDELEMSGQLRRRKTSEQMLAELRAGRSDADQRGWMRRYHQAEVLRLALRDILGLADFDAIAAELSAVANACLEYASDVITRLHRLPAPPFAIIGLGKLGGAELTYGSDLDVMFVAPDASKDLAKLQRRATELLELVRGVSEAGVGFAVDARLRPDGEKGLLVNTLEACARYYYQRAALWELQTLTRVRAVAGDPHSGQRFEALARRLTDFAVHRTNRAPKPAAYRPDWKTQIARMRERIERERTPAGQDRFAIKTGQGGLIDVEFMAQVLNLEHGWHEPNTVRALGQARAAHALPESDHEQLMENYLKLRRIEGTLRRWSFAGETELPIDPEPLRRVAIRCGFTSGEELLAAVSGYRQVIRRIYAKVLLEEESRAESR